MKASLESEEGTLTHPQISRQSPQLDEQSLLDSDFQMNCCCGVKGDGNLLYWADEGEAVQCDECKDWSHIACQRDGRASSLTSKESFVCDFCNLSILKPDFYQKQRVSMRT
jgi:PHD-finger